jgi:hypothetical protein
MSKEMDLLKRILATGWLDHELSCEVEELLAQPEYEADRRSDPISKLRNLRDIQGRKGNYDIDEYMRGLYNGLELSLSIFEDRGPDYKEHIAQPEIRELLTQKREPLSDLRIRAANRNEYFEWGVRFAEKAHGIGGGNE